MIAGHRFHQGRRWRRATPLPRRRSESRSPRGREARSRRLRQAQRGRPLPRRQGTAHRPRRSPRPDEHACPKGCIHLVTAPSDKISLSRKSPVRCALGAIDCYGDVAAVCGVDDFFDRRQPSSDVRSRCGGGQARLREPVQFIGYTGSREGPDGPALDIAARGRARPRQEIGVVFDDRGDHDVARTQARR